MNLAKTHKTKAGRTSRRVVKKAPSRQGSAKLTAVAADVEGTRSRLGLTRVVFARFFGCSERSIAAWEAGKRPGRSSAQRLTELNRLVDALNEFIKHDRIDAWLQNPNEAFGGLKPLEVIERGEVDRIWRMIYQIKTGVST